jgi:lipid II:glycine glycyltransferase (peptidoglycan interpeptide bridge formation enzyme)
VDTQGLILRIQGTLGDLEWNRRSVERFVAKGFIPAHSKAYRTMVLDLRPSLSDIRAALAQKWRNCLNKAERNNPAPCMSSDLKDFKQFTALFDPFVGRKGFTVDLGADFYSQVQSRSAAAEALTLTLVKSAEEDKKERKLRAGHMSSMLGDTCVYLLGATSDEALKKNAAYLLQWNVIKVARERGMTWYDLGGIDPQGNPGVYHFKSGLGGVEMIAPGPFEYSPKTLRSRLILQTESAYRRWRQPPTASTPPAGFTSIPEPAYVPQLIGNGTK